MKISDMMKAGDTSQSRVSVESTPPSNGIGNVTEADNSSVLMNLAAGVAPRGSRADALIEMAGMDNYRLANEPARRGKMKG
jgi:hypothetical protein